MKQYAPFALLSLFFLIGCESAKSPERVFKEVTAALYDSALMPFYHGVASGDPLQDRVILWTRVTPPDSTMIINVRWEIALASDFDTVVQTDTLSTSANRDFTVKVDVKNLTPGTTYYYRFLALGRTSVTGRTKTLPTKTDRITLAVVSCANWEFGYFTPYEKIANRADVDAVLHLGDYLYEYKAGGYGDTTIGRFHLPPHEIVTLWDYRTRHAQYRLDKGLAHVSQQHPMIAIWDDHEIANDSYTQGAQNHQPEEGDYDKRKAAARQAYYEWLPIREGAKHYRAFSFGDLADLVMLDERLEGRTKQVDSLTDPTFADDSRAILGAEQLAWFKNQLSNSAATWKIIGNQAMFSDVVQNPEFRRTPRNFDSWDGYPAEKNNVIDFVIKQNIQNLIFVTGDTHASWGIEVPASSLKSKKPIAVEFGTTSISSGNDDERKPVEVVKEIERQVMQDNPHIKYFNDRDHGYLLLTLTTQQATAEWYYVKTLRQPISEEVLGKQIVVKPSSARLMMK